MATASWLDPRTRQARLKNKQELQEMPEMVHKLEVKPNMRGKERVGICARACEKCGGGTELLKKHRRASWPRCAGRDAYSSVRWEPN